MSGQGVGYGVVVGTADLLPSSATDIDRTMKGVGFFFAGLMLVLTFLQSKFSKFSPTSSEEFTVRKQRSFVFHRALMCTIRALREV